MAYYFEPSKFLPKKAKWPKYAVGGFGLAVVLTGAVLYWHGVHARSPVPTYIRSSVTFSVYYPAQNRLPHGYYLDTTSFRVTQSGVVEFWVKNGGGQTFTFSEEQQPPQDIISKFTSATIPLHNTVSSRLGQAEIGAYNTGSKLETVASFPINKGPWIIITAASDANQADLKQTVLALTK